MSALTARGIVLRDDRPGAHRAACPACAGAKARPGDGALAVKVDPDGSATWLCHRCGWKGAVGAERHERVPAGRPGLSLRAPEPGPDTASLREAARRFLRACAKPAAGGPVARYLAGRGCAMPGTDILEHPACRHPRGHVGPCMVAVVTDAVTNEPLSLHRTWLAPGGAGKARIGQPRLLWPGLPSRGVVRLFGDDAVTLGLCVAEGIETALVAARAFGPATWACLSAGNLAALPVLDGVEALTVVADNDRPDRRGRRAGREAAGQVAERWLAAGRGVRVWTAPEEGADFADLAAAAGRAP